MDPLLLPFLSYAVLMIFTPGPNNLMASALGLRGGFRETLPTLLGVASGFFLVALAGGLLTEFLTRAYDRVAPWLRWIGAAYIAWLALAPFLAAGKAGADAGGSGGWAAAKASAPGAGFLTGLLLQFVNPKGLLFALTVFGSFAPLVARSATLALAWSLLLSLLCLASVATWALAGSALSRLYARPRFRLGFNLAMAALLAWTAWSIIAH